MRRFLLGCALGAGVISFFWFNPQKFNSAHSVYVEGFQVHSRAEDLLATGDGQAIATLARGQTIHQSQNGGMGYRARRPLPPALAWLGALGHPEWVPYSMLVLSILGCGLLAYAVSDWIGSPLGALVVLFPGVMMSLEWFGPEALGLGLAIIGWRRRNVFLLTLAGLTRETLLLFSIHRRKWIPVAVYGAWTLVTVLVWGWDAPAGVFGPLALFTTPAHDGTGIHIAAIVLTLGFGLVALRFQRGLAGMFLGLALVLGPAVSYLWSDITRVLLPLWVLGFVGAAHLLRPQVVGTEHQRWDEDLSTSAALT